MNNHSYVYFQCFVTSVCGPTICGVACFLFFCFSSLNWCCTVWELIKGKGSPLDQLYFRVQVNRALPRTDCPVLSSLSETGLLGTTDSWRLDIHCLLGTTRWLDIHCLLGTTWRLDIHCLLGTTDLTIGHSLLFTGHDLTAWHSLLTGYNLTAWHSLLTGYDLTVGHSLLS